MSKNVAVFVDVANIFYAAKAAGVDIDYVTLLKAATAGRDFVRAYAYTGLDPDNENQRNFHQFLARNAYKVVSKDIRKYGDGKVKANLDIELVVDMMKTARNLDIAVLVSGDGDFAPAIRAVQEMGVRVEVVSFKGNTSSDLIEAADQFLDITQIARVDKSSTRSGRRVAGDEADLSMTEVPEKQTEGATERARRGRGRGRAAAVEAPAARTAAPRAVAARAAAPRVAAAPGAGPSITILPGEKLSRAGVPAAEEGAFAEGGPEPAEEEAREEHELELAAEAGGRRRRRRRGGRGRGRGRAGEAPVSEGGAIVSAEGEAEAKGEGEPFEEEEPAVAAAPRGRRPTPFGSVWDSQIGMPAAPRGDLPLPPDEDIEEPEIPEYLLAERRQQGRGGAGRSRGPRSAYTVAVERERYGRGGGGATGGGGRGGGVSRFPSGGPRGTGGRREERAGGGGGRSGGRSAEPWSEVPPELEAILRAQLAQKLGRPAEPSPTGSRPTEPGGVAERAAPPKRRATRTKAAGAASLLEPAAPTEAAPAEAAPKRRATRTKAAGAASLLEPAAPTEAALAEAAPKRRATRTKAAGAASLPAAADAAPKRRTRRPTAAGD